MTVQLSILICCYNEEKQIADCIKSLQLTANPSWEAVVINDASTDKTGVILNFLSQKLHNLRCFHLDHNVGLGDARNFAILQAKGEYICFLDGNDYLNHEDLQKNIEIAQKQKADIVVTPHLRVEPSGINLIPTFQGEFSGEQSLALYLARIFGSWSACFSVMRRQMVIEASCHFVHRLLYEDVSFCMTAFRAVKKGISSQHAHYVYNRLDTSITRKSHYSFFHALSSSKLYYDICTYVLDQPKNKQIINAFIIACKILETEHYPRICNTVATDFFKQDRFIQKKFLRYISNFDSRFSRMILELISSN